jgi:glycosyltransferase involved in cell wall biosynthesis
MSTIKGNARLKILYVIPTFRFRDGGPTQALLQMSHEIASRGHQVAIYCTSHDSSPGKDCPDVASLAGQGIELRYFPTLSPFDFKFAPEIGLALRDAIPNYDVIHINSLYQYPSTVAAYYARRFQKPYIVRPHGTLDPYIYRRHRLRKRLYELLIERHNLEHALAVHFTTQEEMDLAGLLGFKINGVVIPLGVNVDPDPSRTVFRAEMEARWPQTREKKIILFFGRLNFKKGLDLLARAFGKAARQRPDLHLLIVGPDEEGYGRKVRQWVEEEGVSEKVTFTGMLLGRQKSVVLRGADIFVLASRSENFGIAVGEAAACGLPVVISNKVNIWRDLQAAGAAIVINCEISELTCAIVKLTEDSELRKSMGQKGRELVRERYSWRAAGDGLEKIYRQTS